MGQNPVQKKKKGERNSQLDGMKAGHPFNDKFNLFHRATMSSVFGSPRYNSLQLINRAKLSLLWKCIKDVYRFDANRSVIPLIGHPHTVKPGNCNKTSSFNDVCGRNEKRIRMIPIWMIETLWNGHGGVRPGSRET